MKKFAKIVLGVVVGIVALIVILAVTSGGKGSAKPALSTRQQAVEACKAAATAANPGSPLANEISSGATMNVQPLVDASNDAPSGSKLSTDILQWSDDIQWSGQSAYAGNASTVVTEDCASLGVDNVGPNSPNSN
jgi:hypothetical protein